MDDLLDLSQVQSALEPNAPEPQQEQAPVEPAVPSEPPTPSCKVVIDLEDGSGVQVFEGKTNEEVIEKLRVAQIHATRKIREQGKELKQLRKAPDQAPRETAFSKSELSEDERWRLSLELQDPAKAPVAVKKLVEAEFGAPLEDVRETLKSAQSAVNWQRAAIASQEFVASTPEYFPCTENQTAILDFLNKQGYPVTKANLAFAFAELRQDGLLVERPSNAAPQVSPDPDLPVTPDVPGKVVSIVDRGARSTGLRPSEGSRGGATPKQRYTQAQIEAMSAQEYKERILLGRSR